MKFQAELTDTFGGEANYSWVERREWIGSREDSDAKLIRKAKKELGITGRHKKEDWGDTIALRFSGANVILFINHLED